MYGTISNLLKLNKKSKSCFFLLNKNFSKKFCIKIDDKITDTPKNIIINKTISKYEEDLYYFNEPIIANNIAILYFNRDKLFELLSRKTPILLKSPIKKSFNFPYCLDPNKIPSVSIEYSIENKTTEKIEFNYSTVIEKQVEIPEYIVTHYSKYWYYPIKNKTVVFINIDNWDLTNSIHHYYSNYYFIEQELNDINSWKIVPSYYKYRIKRAIQTRIFLIKMYLLDNGFIEDKYKI